MYKFNFLFSFILVISFGCDDPISCPNGKVNIDGACVCPKNQFELNGLCKPIEDDMYFIVENQCDCFESEIVLLKFTESDSSSTSIGRILLKDESNYPLSNYYTENDIVIIPGGTRVHCKINKIQKGKGGKRGIIEIEALYIETHDGTHIPLKEAVFRYVGERGEDVVFRKGQKFKVKIAKKTKLTIKY